MERLSEVCNTLADALLCVALNYLSGRQGRRSVPVAELQEEPEPAESPQLAGLPVPIAVTDSSFRF